MATVSLKRLQARLPGAAAREVVARWNDAKFVKLNRARWEVTLKTVPKQMAPYLMLRHHTITQSEEGLRIGFVDKMADGI